MSSATVVATLRSRPVEHTSSKTTGPLHEIPKKLAIQRPKHGQSSRWFVMAAAAFLTFLWAVNSFRSLPASHRMAQTDGLVHIVGGGAAVLLGPFQFLGDLRKQKPWVHRWLGRAYVASVVMGGSSGLIVSWDRAAFPIAKWSFTALDCAWLFTLAMGVYHIRNGAVELHRAWIIRNFALTYAAVMLRAQAPILALGFGLSHAQIVNIIPWSCWVPNLIFVEWYLRR